MRLHYLQHVAFEGPAAIKAWAADRGYSLTRHRVFEGDTLPNPGDVDGLVVMGGPMGVNDGDTLPWLKSELDYIRGFIDSGKALLGICLGAQLIAHALGAKVSPNPYKEIGWFPLRTTVINKALGDSHPLTQIIPNNMPVFHWHGDTFAIPAGAELLASSEACNNQGFIYRDRVLALQFHLEATHAWAQRLIEHCSDELDGSRYVQSGEQMLAEPQRFVESNRVMAQLLDTWIAFQ